MQDQPSRLDRIEAALERMQQQYDNERQLVAELRTWQEIQSQQISDLRITAEAFLQTLQLHQENIEVLAEAMRRHRSDGHGA